MRLIATALTALVLGGCVMPGMPGMGMPPNFGGVGGTGMTSAEVANAESSMKAAQAMGAASANRPGDEAMTCAQIQAEIVATMQDPKVMAAVGTMGARAQDTQAKLDGARAGQQQTFTKEDARAPLASANDLTSIMPQIMRGQRLNELAAAKKCPGAGGQ